MKINWISCWHNWVYSINQCMEMNWQETDVSIRGGEKTLFMKALYYMLNQLIVVGSQWAVSKIKKWINYKRNQTGKDNGRKRSHQFDGGGKSAFMQKWMSCRLYKNLKIKLNILYFKKHFYLYDECGILIFDVRGFYSIDSTGVGLL